MNRRTEQLQRGYEPPAITDHGSLTELTQAIELRHVASIATMGIQFAATVIGKPPPIDLPDPPLDLPDPPKNGPDPNVVPDVTPSGGGGGGGGGGGTGVPNTPLDPGGSGGAGGETVTTGTNHLGTPSSGGTGDVSGSGGGASGGGGGGSLPFTGYALALVAGVGMTMAAAGRLLQRASRR